MITSLKLAVFSLCFHMVISCSPHGNIVGTKQLYGRPHPGQDGLYGPEGPDLPPCNTNGIPGVRGPRAARGPVGFRGPPSGPCRTSPDRGTIHKSQTTSEFQRLMSLGASAEQIFEALDVDRNGYITRNEWINKGGESSTYTKLQFRFDRNGDSQFDITEARAVWSDQEAPSQEEPEDNSDRHGAPRHPFDIPVRSTVDDDNRYRDRFNPRGIPGIPGEH